MAAKKLLDDKGLSYKEINIEKAGISREEAKRTVIDEMVEDARHDSARQIRLMEEQAKADADREAKKMIAFTTAYIK